MELTLSYPLGMMKLTLLKISMDIPVNASDRRLGEYAHFVAIDRSQQGLQLFSTLLDVLKASSAAESFTLLLVHAPARIRPAGVPS